MSRDLISNPISKVKSGARHSVSSLGHSYILVGERPSPFKHAEAIKRRYVTRLDKLLAAYEREISASLDGSNFSPTYKAAEIDGYLHRLSQVLRAHEGRASERAAAAELAERGQAWVEQTEGGA
jgi:hypothetical protein